MLSRKKAQAPAVPALKYQPGDLVAWEDWERTGGSLQIFRLVKSFLAEDGEAIHRITPIEGTHTFGKARSFLTADDEIVAVKSRRYFAKHRQIIEFDGLALNEYGTASDEARAKAIADAMQAAYDAMPDARAA